MTGEVRVTGEVSAVNQEVIVNELSSCVFICKSTHHGRRLVEVSILTTHSTLNTVSPSVQSCPVELSVMSV